MIYLLAYLAGFGWMAAYHCYRLAARNEAHYELAMRGWRDCNESWRVVCREIVVRTHCDGPQGVCVPLSSLREATVNVHRMQGGQ